MDDLARELDMDPAELRLRNLHPKFTEPRAVPSGARFVQDVHVLTWEA